VPADEEIAGINDSKKLNERQLEHLFERLTTNPRVVFAVSIIDHKRIDQINILRASMEAMSEAVAALAVKADYVLVDGDKLPSFETKVGAEAVIKGGCDQVFTCSC
jgi:ribonuclease HII